MAKPAKKKSLSVRRKSLLFNYQNNKVLAFVILFALVGVSLLLFANAQERPYVLRKFQDNPQRGVTWAGLRVPGPGSQCPVDLLEVVDREGVARGCTHGPDPAPDGVDATKSVEPLDTGELSGATLGAVTCEGDGISGARVQLIYARATDRADRFDQFASSFQQYATVMDNIYKESGAQTGQPKAIRFVHDATCNVKIDRVTLTTTGDDSIGNLAKELINQGYYHNDRKFVVWLDNTPFCGMGYIMGDDRPTADNKHNYGGSVGPSYGAVGAGCWGGRTETHELTHTLGGVQRSAPHSTAGYHCTDEYDRMCYNDGGVTLTYNCASSEESRLDCGKDDYFNTSPPSGSYLSLKWNLANSRFLFNTSLGGTDPVPTPPPPTNPSDTSSPLISIGSPRDGSVIGNSVTISASATDNVGVTKIEVYIDGQLKASVNGSSISTKWNSRRASRGTHSILVKAYDAAGNTSQSTVSVVKD